MYTKKNVFAETGSNSAYSGDEESESEVPSGKKKKAFKHMAACSSDGFIFNVHTVSHN